MANRLCQSGQLLVRFGAFERQHRQLWLRRLRRAAKVAGLGFRIHCLSSNNDYHPQRDGCQGWLIQMHLGIHGIRCRNLGKINGLAVSHDGPLFLSREAVALAGPNLSRLLAVLWLAAGHQPMGADSSRRLSGHSCDLACPPRK
jgi:hypothetical protein